MFQKKFHHFRHDKPAVDLNLDHVADWFTTYPQALDYEILGLVRGDTNTNSERQTRAVTPKKNKAARGALGEVYEYFAKGHTFILNTVRTYVPYQPVLTCMMHSAAPAFSGVPTQFFAHY